MKPAKEERVCVLKFAVMSVDSSRSALLAAVLTLSSDKTLLPPP
jgi:hypothetical protein